MRVQSPDVVHVVAFLDERAHEADVLKKPVASLVVGAAAADAAVIVSAVLKKNPNRLPLVLPNDVGVPVASTKIHEAPDDAEHFVEAGRPLPRHGERGNGA